MAEKAYDDFRRDAFYSLGVSDHRMENSAVEMEHWETVKHRVDKELSLFEVNIYGVDAAPFTFPRGGWTYQVVGGGWKTAQGAALYRDATANTLISAPTAMEGRWVISYKFSMWRWLWAWIRWTFELIARLLVVSFLVALLAYTAYRIPWHTVRNLGLALVRAVLQRIWAIVSVWKATATPDGGSGGGSVVSPTPTSAPMGYYGTSRIEVGK